MRTGGEVVQVVTREDTVTGSVLVQVEHFASARRFKYIEVFNHKLVFLCPTDSQTDLAVKGGTTSCSSFIWSLHDLRVQKIEHLLVVDLQEADED